MKVDIISKELIKPSSPTPSKLRNFKLSFLDQQIPPSYVPLIIYYMYDETSNLTQSHMSFRLRKSLSDALTQFYPLAGRMKGQSSVDCNDEGVSYIETQVDGELSGFIECPQVEVLDEFTPFKSYGIVGLSGAEEQLAIQVNLFKCGGIVIGICFSHRIADACTLCNFINGWAATARGDHNFACPIFNAASFFPSKDSPEYNFNPKSLTLQPPRARLVTRRFVFTAEAIAALRAEVENSSTTIRPTRVEVVSALVWKCGIAAAGLTKHRTSVAFHPVNLRGKMEPPILEYSFGNLFQMASAVTSGGETELACLVGKLRAAFAKIDSEYIRKILGEDGFEIVKSNFKEMGKLMSQGDVQLLRFSSWCRFPIYEADFGWGKPTWVSSASYPQKDSVFFLDSRWDGGIEAWIILNEKEMENFEKDSDLQTYTSSYLGN